MRDTNLPADNKTIVYTIGRLYVLLNQYLSTVYAPFGLNPAKFNLLMVIKHVGKEKGISQNTLKNMLYVSAANITKLLDGLQKHGWCQRLASEQDRRVKVIQITARGSRLLDEVWPRHQKAMNMFMRGFSESDKKQMGVLLQRFLKELEPHSGVGNE